MKFCFNVVKITLSALPDGLQFHFSKFLPFALKIGIFKSLYTYDKPENSDRGTSFNNTLFEAQWFITLLA